MRRSVLGLAALAIPFVVGHASAQTWTVISEALAGDVQIIDPVGSLPCELLADILLSKEYESPCGFHHEGLRRARLALPGGVEYTVGVDFDLHTYDYWNGAEFDVFYLNAGTSTFSPSSITSLGVTTCGQTYSGMDMPGVPGQTWWWGGNQDCPPSVCNIFGSFTFETGSLDPGVTTYLEVGLKTGFR